MCLQDMVRPGLVESKTHTRNPHMPLSQVLTCVNGADDLWARPATHREEMQGRPMCVFLYGDLHICRVQLSV